MPYLAALAGCLTLATGDLAFAQTSSSQGHRVALDSGASADFFGYAVDLAENRVVIGAPRRDLQGGQDHGEVFVGELGADGKPVGAFTTLRNQDPRPGDLFGWSVATAGDYLLVGARSDDEDGDSTAGLYENVGSASFFIRRQGQWQFLSKVFSRDFDQGDSFGYAVAMTPTIAVISAPLHAVNRNGKDRGAVYVFARNPNDGQWKPVQKLVAPDGVDEQRFGASVAISPDSQTIAVGSPDDPSQARSGSVYIFRASAAARGYALVAPKLVPNDAAANQGFGFSVALRNDRVLVGAPTKGTTPGAAYIFGPANAAAPSGAWQQKQKLSATSPKNRDLFGFSVDIDGSKAVVSTYINTGRGAAGDGAYLFEESGGTWSHLQTKTPPSGSNAQGFGNSVALSGERVIVGAFEDTPTGGVATGAGFVFAPGSQAAPVLGGFATLLCGAGLAGLGLRRRSRA